MAKKLGTLKVKRFFLGRDSGNRGTEVTSSAAELNIMDGVTADAAELNYLDVTPGAAVASKAVVLDASGDWGKGGDITVDSLRGFVDVRSKSLEVGVDTAYSGGIPAMQITGASGVGTAISAATFIIDINVPVGSLILGCQMIVMTDFKAGDTWDAAYSGGTTQTIISNQAVDLNTKVNVFYDANAATAITATNPTDITITKNGGGSFATPFGAIVGWIYYMDFTAPGDYS